MKRRGIILRTSKRVRRITQRPEQDLQIVVMQWLRIACPKVIAAHCPNGGKRNRVEAIRLKQMGVLAGFPDLMLFYEKRAYFIEMKAPGRIRATSDDQEDVLARLSRNGFECAVCDSLQSVKNCIALWGLPCREV